MTESREDECQILSTCGEKPNFPLSSEISNGEDSMFSTGESKSMTCRRRHVIAQLMVTGGDALSLHIMLLNQWEGLGSLPLVSD